MGVNGITENGMSAVGTNSMTMNELFEDWLKRKQADLQPSTYKHYLSKYRHYLEKQFGDTIVNDITQEQWTEYMNTLSTVTGVKGKPLTLPIIRNIGRLFHMVFIYGKEEYGLNDPTGDITITRMNASSENVFSEQEIERMKKAVKPYDVRHLCIMLCIYTGVQIGEMCGAKWGDMDTEKSLLIIRRSLVRACVYGDSGKTELRLTDERQKCTFRDVSIPDWINDQFKLIKRIHTDDEFIIVGKFGGVEPNNFVNTYYAQFLNIAGVKYRPFTATRNTYVKNCIEQGIKLDTLSEMLGLPNSEHTKQKYSEFFKREDNLIEQK